MRTYIWIRKQYEEQWTAEPHKSELVNALLASHYAPRGITEPQEVRGANGTAAIRSFDQTVGTTHAAETMAKMKIEDVPATWQSKLQEGEQ